VSAEPIAYGKVVAPGVLGVPYADSTGLDFPNSYPVAGSSPLSDGSMVYDSSVSVEIENTNPYPVALAVVTEAYTPGTATALENVTLPNGTTVLEPTTVPARLDPTWSNGTVSAAAFSSGTVTLPLANAGAEESLSVKIAGVAWGLSYLTPATDSLAGVFTAGGLWAFGAVVAVVTLAALLVGLIFAHRLAKRIGRSPKVPVLWPVLWAVVPIVWFGAGYVSFNQTLGPLSPAFLPVPLVVAAFPYLPRLFSRYWEMVEVEGLGASTPDHPVNPKATLPLVVKGAELTCAPETWREALYSHWVGLPPVEGYEVSLVGQKTTVQPRLIQVTPALPLGYYQSDATASCWYDSRAGIARTRHKLAWTTEREEPTLAADGVTVTGKRSRRRFSPHIVPGGLRATFPPKLPVAEVLAGVRSAEVAAHDAEVLGIRIAGLQARHGHDRIAYGVEVAEEIIWFYETGEKPRRREEGRQLVESRRNRALTGERKAEGKETGAGA
jgi:hypothetical protein